jgi:hypothetical protein
MGGGAALVVGALGFELARRHQESQAEDARTQVSFQSHVDSMDTLKTNSRVFLGLGGAALITGGILFLLNEPQRESPPPVAFGCGSDGCTASARGSF